MKWTWNEENCKHNPGIVCENPAKCATCGWNPAVARRRIRERQKVGPQQPTTTYFQKITASKEVLSAFLLDITAICGPWDKLFQREYCAECKSQNCDWCPHEAERRNPAWFLDQAVDDGNDPLW